MRLQRTEPAPGPGASSTRARALRILLAVGNGIVGGMETAVLRLVRALPSGAFETHVLLPFDGPFAASLRACGASVAFASMPAHPHWYALQTGVRIVRDRDIDLIHAHYAPAHLLAALIGSVTGVPVLATVHGMHLAMPDLEAHRMTGTFLCVVSEAARDHALAVGAMRDRLSVIRNAVDTDLFSPAPGASPREFGAGPVVAFVGRLSPEKHPLLFVRIAARALEACPSARFVVVGDGPLHAEMESAARRLNADHALHFAGTRHDMPAVYRSVDLLVLTSWHEGTPLAVLEAFASGIPVVASDTGGVREMVANGCTGWLFDPGDERDAVTRVVAALEDATWRHDAGRRARADALARFGLQAQVSATTALWSSIVERQAREPAAARMEGNHYR